MDSLLDDILLPIVKRIAPSVQRTSLGSE